MVSAALLGWLYCDSVCIASDKPTVGDYDGDGKTDLTIFRDGVWYLLRSQQGVGAVQFGTTNDRPIPAAFVPLGRGVVKITPHRTNQWT